MKQILCFGDSNTYGLIPGTSDRYEWGVRWTSRLSEKIRTKGYQVIEEGLCGRTTIFDDPARIGRRGTELLPVVLESHTPIELVILMLGTNDCKTAYGATPEKIGKGIEELLGQIRSNSPNCKVLLISPIYLGEKVWQKGYDEEFSEASIYVSKELENVYEEIADKSQIAFLRAADFAKASITDQEHLDKEGHKKLADAIYRKVDELLSA